MLNARLRIQRMTHSVLQYLIIPYIYITTLQLFHKKNVIQDFLMYNKFANKKIRKKVILYDKLIIQRKNYNW